MRLDCRYIDIVTYKTAYYSFYLPVACGLHLAGAATDDALATAKGILIKMGQYFQIQDDYLDCFADAETLGKVGTDIQDNKCSWLVCKALEQASDVQRGVISDNYGKDDAECIAKVKAVFACAAHHTAFVCPPFALCVHVHPTTLCVLQRKNGIPTGLACPCILTDKCVGSLAESCNRGIGPQGAPLGTAALNQCLQAADTGE